MKLKRDLIAEVRQFLNTQLDNQWCFPLNPVKNDQCKEVPLNLARRSDISVPEAPPGQQQQ